MGHLNDAISENNAVPCRSDKVAVLTVCMHTET